MKTLEELRKEASELKIKNYCKYNKIQLIALIEKVKEENNPRVIVNLPAVISESIFDVMRRKMEDEKKRLKSSLELPREGTQARQIYDIFKAHVGHKRWTVYRVVKDYGYSLNNVRRIYKKYFEDTNKEIFAKKEAEKALISGK